MSLFVLTAINAYLQISGYSVFPARQTMPTSIFKIIGTLLKDLTLKQLRHDMVNAVQVVRVSETMIFDENLCF